MSELQWPRKLLVGVLLPGAFHAAGSFLLAVLAVAKIQRSAGHHWAGWGELLLLLHGGVLAVSVLVTLVISLRPWCDAWRLFRVCTLVSLLCLVPAVYGWLTAG